MLGIIRGEIKTDKTEPPKKTNQRYWFGFVFPSYWFGLVYDFEKKILGSGWRK